MGNKNDKPISTLEECIEVKKEDVLYLNYFEKVCELRTSKEDQKLYIINETNKNAIKKRGIVYLLVVEGKILKIGSSTTSLKDRIQSYNCGKEKYRRDGTCSTANYFVLQTLLNLNKIVEVYAIFSKDIEIEFLPGLIIKTEFPLKPLENIILKDLKNKGKMPALCTQT